MAGLPVPNSVEVVVTNGSLKGTGTKKGLKNARVVDVNGGVKVQLQPGNNTTGRELVIKPFGKHTAEYLRDALADVLKNFDERELDLELAITVELFSEEHQRLQDLQTRRTDLDESLQRASDELSVYEPMIVDLEEQLAELRRRQELHQEGFDEVNGHTSRLDGKISVLTDRIREHEGKLELLEEKKRKFHHRAQLKALGLDEADFEKARALLEQLDS